VSSPLTAVVVQRGELGALVPTAGAVAGLHLQLVPGGLAQLRQEHVRRDVGAHRLPRPRAWRPPGLAGRYRARVGRHAMVCVLF